MADTAGSTRYVITDLSREAFDYLKPTDPQLERMDRLREAAKEYADTLIAELPEGPDKTYLLRRLREVAMWANVAVTRHPNGTPRV